MKEQRRKEFGLRMRTAMGFMRRRELDDVLRLHVLVVGPVRRVPSAGWRSPSLGWAHVHNTRCGTVPGAKIGSVSTLGQAGELPV